MRESVVYQYIYLKSKGCIRAIEMQHDNTVRNDEQKQNGLSRRRVKGKTIRLNSRFTVFVGNHFTFLKSCNNRPFSPNDPSSTVLFCFLLNSKLRSNCEI